MSGFSILILGLSGLVLFNIGRTGPTDWLDDSQTRIEKAAGNKHANFNLSSLISYWSGPVYNPSRWRGSETFKKRVQARLDSYSSNLGTHEEGARNVIKYNYRTGGGVGPTPRIYHKSA